MEEQEGYIQQAFGDSNSRMVSIEEKQRILKDQILLLGQNLIEVKEKTNKRMMEMKKDIELIKQTVERMSSFLETISGEFSKFAKKEDLEILTRQAKMFQPLDFVRKKDLEKLKNV
jgi:hypothetical protein